MLTSFPDCVVCHERSETVTMPDLVIDFTKFGNSDAYIGDGWHSPEASGTWTSNAESILQLPCPSPATKFTLQISARPFLAEGKLPSQVLNVSIDGVQAEFEFGHEMNLAFEVAAKAGDNAVARTIEIKFETPDARSPFDIGWNRDVRKLGFCFHRVTLRWEGAPLARQLVAPRRLPRVAAVTMTYNESELLPIWLRHNARQVGLENCFVVDHGSDDGSTDQISPANRIRIPRSPYDAHKQSAWNTDFCSSLLHWYDYVIYSDVDEIIVADPKIAPTITEFCRRQLPPVLNVIGLNVQHLVGQEQGIDLTRPILQQRPYVFFCSPMCKPLLIRRKVVWSPGSHSADAPVEFDHLYAFHLRWFDLPEGLRRLARTRSMAWARLDAGAHARVEDDRLEQMFNAFASLHRLDDIEFDPLQEPIRPWLQRVRDSQEGREADTYKISLGIWPTHLWRVPPRFSEVF